MTPAHRPARATSLREIIGGFQSLRCEGRDGHLLHQTQRASGTTEIVPGRTGEELPGIVCAPALPKPPQSVAGRVPDFDRLYGNDPEDFAKTYFKSQREVSAPKAASGPWDDYEN